MGAFTCAVDSWGSDTPVVVARAENLVQNLLLPFAKVYFGAGGGGAGSHAIGPERPEQIVRVPFSFDRAFHWTEEEANDPEVPSDGHKCCPFKCVNAQHLHEQDTTQSLPAKSTQRMYLVCTAFKEAE